MNNELLTSSVSKNVWKKCALYFLDFKRVPTMMICDWLKLKGLLMSCHSFIVIIISSLLGSSSFFSDYCGPSHCCFSES